MSEASRPILLVEDNPDDVELTLLALRRNHFTNDVVVARDGVEALDYLAQRGADCMPLVVLLDLKLPRLDGLEVLRRMRADEHTRLVPVVVLTSSKVDEDIVQSYSRGANSYIRKPVDFDRFVEAVRQLGMYWLLLNEPIPG